MKAANFFTKAGSHTYAKEVLLKMDDIKSLMKVSQFLSSSVLNNAIRRCTLSCIAGMKHLI